MSTEDNKLLTIREAMQSGEIAYTYSTAKGFHRSLDFINSACAVAERAEAESYALFDFVTPHKLALAIIDIVSELEDVTLIDYLMTYVNGEGHQISSMTFENANCTSDKTRLCDLTIMLQDNANALAEACNYFSEHFG